MAQSFRGWRRVPKVRHESRRQEATAEGMRSLNLAFFMWEGCKLPKWVRVKPRMKNYSCEFRRGFFGFSKIWCMVWSHDSWCTTNVEGHEVKCQGHDQARRQVVSAWGHHDSLRGPRPSAQCTMPFYHNLEKLWQGHNNCLEGQGTPVPPPWRRARSWHENKIRHKLSG